MKQLLYLTTFFWLFIMFVGVVPFVTSKPPPNTKLNLWQSFVEIAHLGKGWYLVGGVLLLIVILHYIRQTNKLKYLLQYMSLEKEKNPKK